jgi:hypothetical protein
VYIGCMILYIGRGSANILRYYTGECQYANTVPKCEVQHTQTSTTIETLSSCLPVTVLCAGTNGDPASWPGLSGKHIIILIFPLFIGLFAMPLTIFLAETTFSKLKLLKNHLRSVMSQERLNGFTHQQGLACRRLQSTYHTQ